MQKHQEKDTTVRKTKKWVNVPKKKIHQKRKAGKKIMKSKNNFEMLMAVNSVQELEIINMFDLKRNLVRQC